MKTKYLYYTISQMNLGETLKYGDTRITKKVNGIKITGLCDEYAIMNKEILLINIPTYEEMNTMYFLASEWGSLTYTRYNNGDGIGMIDLFIENKDSNYRLENTLW